MTAAALLLTRLVVVTALLPAATLPFTSVGTLAPGGVASEITPCDVGAGARVFVASLDNSTRFEDGPFDDACSGDVRLDDAGAVFATVDAAGAVSVSAPEESAIWSADTGFAAGTACTADAGGLAVAVC